MTGKGIWDMAGVVVRQFSDYHNTVYPILDEPKLAQRLEKSKKIIIKHNLLQDTPPPCTTDVKYAETVARHMTKKIPCKKIIIFEGSGG